jgi:hypothetical protein
MAMFEYIMVLASIIIGLAMTHLLQGVAGIVQHPKRDRLWWVHLVWVGWVFLFAIFWWWWEFRYRLVQEWTFPLYVFVVAYAFLVYLMAAMLFPKDLEGYDGFKDYFLARRRWFFALLFAACVFDFADTWLKGPEHFASLGPEYFVYLAVVSLGAVWGALTRSERAHAAIGVVLLAYQASWAALSFTTVD